MHKNLLYAAYGFLLVTGALHFCIDVVSQYVRGKRAPGPEATLYYGLHTAYALGQVLFALMALLIVRSGADLMSQRLGQGLSFLAVAGWLTICFAFIEYYPPLIHMAIVFVILVLPAL